jgi:hypothetical protein
MKRIAAVAIVLVAIVGASVAAYLMFTGPRMKVQPRRVAFQSRLPPTPVGVVPLTTGRPIVPLPQPDSQVRNPLPDDEQTLRAGRVFYGYYCLFCHGTTGRGDGPVGQSYMPVPTDLTSSQVQLLSDANLYRAMLTGVGHDPILLHATDPNERWYLVSFVRSLAPNR